MSEDSTRTKPGRWVGSASDDSGTAYADPSPVRSRLIARGSLRNPKPLAEVRRVSYNSTDASFEAFAMTLRPFLGTQRLVLMACCVAAAVPALGQTTSDAVF